MSTSAATAMLSASLIVAAQDYATEAWHQPEASRVASSSEFPDLVIEQHHTNFELWHLEDAARVEQVSDRDLARVKREIDRINQRRNDLSEHCDATLLEWLAERRLPNPKAELHSESPGLMIDRLSILSLKIFHTAEEIDRPDAPVGHGERNRGRLAVLTEQREDLASCLDALWRQVLAGQRRFKLYRQLKMYNDPTLNPAVYGTREGE